MFGVYSMQAPKTEQVDPITAKAETLGDIARYCRDMTTPEAVAEFDVLEWEIEILNNLARAIEDARALPIRRHR